MSVMGIVKDLLEEIDKLKTDKLKRKYIQSLVPIPGASYTNLNEAFRLIKNQRPMSQAEYKELPMRSQIFNEEGVRVRDLVGRPSVVEQATLADAVKARATENQKGKNEEIVELVNNTKLALPEAPMLNRGTQALTSMEMKNLLRRVQREKAKQNVNATFSINATEDDLSSRWAEIQQAQVFSHNILGRDLTPFEMGLVGNMTPVDQAIKESEPSRIVEALKATPGVIYDLVAEYGPKVVQWLKDHESTYDTPLPSITMIMDQAPENIQEFVADAPDAPDAQPRMTDRQIRNMNMREAVTQRHDLLRNIRGGPGETAEIVDVNDELQEPANVHRWSYDIVQTPTHTYELKYNEPK